MGNARNFSRYKMVMLCLLSAIICTFCGCADEPVSCAKSYPISIPYEEHAVKIAKAVVLTVEEQVTIQDISQEEESQDEEILSEDIPLGIDEVYDLVEQGDLSVVTADDSDMSQLKTMSRQILEGKDTWFDWKMADVNGDSVPELINYDNRLLDNSQEAQIFYIFTYEQGKARLVYMDVNDMTEYYFLGANGNMIYSSDSFGTVDTGYYLWSRFAENPEGGEWIKYGQKRLLLEFYDDWLLEENPEYFENIEPGLYCYLETPTVQAALKEQAWVREQISKEEFLRAYKEMTGFDFLTENSDWQRAWEKVFE